MCRRGSALALTHVDSLSDSAASCACAQRQPDARSAANGDIGVAGSIISIAAAGGTPHCTPPFAGVHRNPLGTAHACVSGHWEGRSRDAALRYARLESEVELLHTEAACLGPSLATRPLSTLSRCGAVACCT